MKKLLSILFLGAFLSCTVGVEHENDKDSTRELDSTWKKTENKLEQWGDSAKEKYKDIKGEVEERWDSLDREH